MATAAMVAVVAGGCAVQPAQTGGARSGSSSSGTGGQAEDGAGGTAGGSGGSGTGTGTGDGPPTTRALPSRTGPPTPTTSTSAPIRTTPSTATTPTTATTLPARPATTAAAAPATTGTTRAPGRPAGSSGGSGGGGSSGSGERGDSTGGGDSGSGGTSGSSSGGGTGGTSGGSGGSSGRAGTDDPVAGGGGSTGGSGGSSRAPNDSSGREPAPGTRPPPSAEELEASKRETPEPGYVALFDAITLLPPFALLACLVGLFSYQSLPPEQRYQEPFPPGTLARSISDTCARFEVEPLRFGSVSSGGSSRAVQPDDVELEVKVEPRTGTGGPGGDQVIVRERLRPGVRSPVQTFPATLALLLLLIVLAATAAAAWRTRARR